MHSISSMGIIKFDAILSQHKQNGGIHILLEWSPLQKMMSHHWLHLQSHWESQAFAKEDWLWRSHTIVAFRQKYIWSWLGIQEHHKFSPLIWDVTQWLVFQQHMLHIIISQCKFSLIENFFQQYMLHIIISGHKLAWYKRVNFISLLKEPSKADIDRDLFTVCWLILPLCLGKFRSLLIAVIIHIWKPLSNKNPNSLDHESIQNRVL